MADEGDKTAIEYYVYNMTNRDPDERTSNSSRCCLLINKTPPIFSV